MYEKLKVRIVGLAPLLLHNVQLADPLNYFARELKKVSGKRKKTDEDYAEMSKIEWHGGLYLDKGERVIIPGEMLEAVLIAGAKKSKLGSQFKPAILIDGAFRLEYPSPTDLKKLFADSQFTDRRCVGVNNSKVMRTRPIFNKWSLNYVIHYLSGQVNAEDVQKALTDGGRMCGIGDYRPRFGRFEVESFEAAKE